MSARYGLTPVVWQSIEPFPAAWLTEDLYFFENAELNQGGWEQLSMLRGVSEGAMVKYALQRREPLRSELEALRLALALIESGQTGRSIELGR